MNNSNMSLAQTVKTVTTKEEVDYGLRKGKSFIKGLL